jgi:hypothetical protein
MRSREVSDEGVYRDVYDGSQYKKLVPRQFNGRELHLTFMMNTGIKKNPGHYLFL